MAISSAQVKELREKTGAGMMDCKRALEEAGGDVNAAMESLRKKGIAKAEKRSSRKASEGLLGHAVNGSRAVFVEVNCETDFVAKNENFQKYVSDLTKFVLEKNPKDIDQLLEMNFDGKVLKDYQTDLIAKIGENLGVRRFDVMEAQKGEKIVQYIHSNNKVGSTVVFVDPANKLENQLAREVAMHVTAMSPQYTRRDEVPSEMLNKEKEIIKAQMGDTNKPPEILDKIVTGKLNKYLSEICLDDQVFVCDLESKKTVAKTLSSVDSGIKVKAFARMQVGEDL